MARAYSRGKEEKEVTHIQLLDNFYFGNPFQFGVGVVRPSLAVSLVFKNVKGSALDILDSTPSWVTLTL